MNPTNAMGKASRIKQERRTAIATLPGGSFRTGLEWPSLRPIVLDHNYNGQTVLATRWSVEDARNLANGLLKFCEIAERKGRERLEEIKT